MDDDGYTRFCFDYLKNVDPDLLKEIRFETLESIEEAKRKVIYKKSIGIECKFCKSTNTVQRSNQIRSVDEGETLTTYCNDCRKMYSF